jgi:hypothetical protein
MSKTYIKVIGTDYNGKLFKVKDKKMINGKLFYIINLYENTYHECEVPISYLDAEEISELEYNNNIVI